MGLKNVTLTLLSAISRRLGWRWMVTFDMD